MKYLSTWASCNSMCVTYSGIQCDGKLLWFIFQRLFLSQIGNEVLFESPGVWFIMLTLLPQLPTTHALLTSATECLEVPIASSASLLSLGPRKLINNQVLWDLQ